MNLINLLKDVASFLVRLGAGLVALLVLLVIAGLAGILAYEILFFISGAL